MAYETKTPPNYRSVWKKELVYLKAGEDPHTDGMATTATRCWEATSDDLSGEGGQGVLPLFVLEKADKSIVRMNNRTKVHQQGGLYMRRLPYLSDVHVIKYSPCGAYLMDIGRLDPHYQIFAHQEEELRQTLEVAQSDHPHIRVHDHPPGTCLLGGDSGGQENVRLAHKSSGQCPPAVKKLLEGMNFVSFLSRAARSSVTDTDDNRGTLQYKFGFNGDHSTELGNDGNRYPTFNKGPDKNFFTELNQEMSKLARELFDGVEGKAGSDIYNDPTRRRMNKEKGFGSEKALLEAITILVQGPGERLRIHLDAFNDDSPEGRQHNYHYTVGAWQCLNIEGIEGPTRVAVLGYSRRSVANSLHRAQVHEQFYEEHMRDYYQQMKNKGAMEFSERLFDVSFRNGRRGKKNKGDDICRAPSFRKTVYLSAFADAITQVRAEGKWWPLELFG